MRDSVSILRRKRHLKMTSDLHKPHHHHHPYTCEYAHPARTGGGGGGVSEFEAKRWVSPQVLYSECTAVVMDFQWAVLLLRRLGSMKITWAQELKPSLSNNILRSFLLKNKIKKPCYFTKFYY